MVSLSNYCIQCMCLFFICNFIYKSSAVYEASSEDYLIIILAVERIKALSDFLAWSSSLKTVNTGKPAKSFLRIFRDALILVFVNENCCLCQCFTELHFFY